LVVVAPFSIMIIGATCWGSDTTATRTLDPPPPSLSLFLEKADGKARGFQGGRRRGVRFSLLCNANKKLVPVGVVGGGGRWLQLMAAASVVCSGGGVCGDGSDCGLAVPWDHAVRRRGCTGLIQARSGPDLG
jgi:hypothetical protein